MAINQLKALPLGSDFIALRIADEIYVDKTEMVFSLVVKRGKYFLARPRRFGKSLLISTFESLFKFGYVTSRVWLLRTFGRKMQSIT